jgi:putative addiction module component (TIGR02574 family)
MGNAVADILQLPLADRIEAVEAIWESIAADPAGANLPLSDAQQRELDVRLDAHDRDPKAGASWEIVRERVRRSK